MKKGVLQIKENEISGAKLESTIARIRISALLLCFTYLIFSVSKLDYFFFLEVCST